ncbi:MAG: hypothetical protein Q4G64_08125 [bacterium]|nr:hypothetical protein [bacterium]
MGDFLSWLPWAVPLGLLMGVVVTAFMQPRVARKFRETIAQHPAPSGPGVPRVTEDLIAHVPPLVQEWIRRSGSLENWVVTGSYSRATVRMRTAADKKWRPSEVEMVHHFWPRYSAWQLMHTRLGPLPLTHMTSLTTEGGNVLATLNSAPVTGARRQTLAEMLVASNLASAWTDSPASLAMLPIQWGVTGERSVASTLTIGATTVRVDAAFDQTGDLAELQLTMPDFRTPDGIPTRFEVTGFEEVGRGRRVASAGNVYQLQGREWVHVQEVELHGLEVYPG